MTYAVHALLRALWRLDEENKKLRESLIDHQAAEDSRPLAGLTFIELSLVSHGTAPEAWDMTKPSTITAPIELDSHFAITYVSDALLELAGYDKQPDDLVDIFTSPPWQLALLCTDSNPVLVTVSMRIRKADGSSIPVLVMPMPDPAAIEIKLPRTSWRYMVMPENTEHHDESINLTSAMADNMIDMLWAKDTKGRYLFANKAISQKLLCCDSIDPLGRDDIYFAKRQRALGWKHTFGELCLNSDDLVLQSQQPGRFVEDGLVRNKYMALEVQKSPLYDQRGVLIGTVGTGRDITRQKEAKEALRRSEHRFGMVLRATSDIIWAYDIPRDIVTCGKMDKPDPIMAQQECDCLPTPKAELLRIKEYIRHFFKNGGDNLQHEFRLTGNDGDHIWLLSRGKIMEHDDSGRPLLAVGSHTNITELKAAQVAAEAAARAKSAFLATMSHEIRTPLNGVLGMLQILSNEVVEEKQLQLTNTALDSGRKLLSIINDILDFSTIDAGAANLEQAPFRIRETVQSVQANFQQEIQEKSLQLICSVDRAVPEFLMGDESRIRQILFNIIGNSVKFTCYGSIRIDILLLTPPTDNELRLLVSVEDTGIGMAPEMVSRIFDPFFQIDGSYRRRYQGTGLGLGIVRSLVTMMNGTISVESTPNVGTTICCSLVLGRADEKQEKAPAEEDTPVPNLSPITILLAEDEEINQMAATYLLKKMGHTVITAANGLQVIDKLQEELPDCILMDIQMPDMDGMETTMIIRSGRLEGVETIPIIALTAHAMKGDRERFISAGMDGYLSKPIDGAELQKELYRILSSREKKGILKAGT